MLTSYIITLLNPFVKYEVRFDRDNIGEVVF